MTPPPSRPSPAGVVYFCFANPVGFSGQKAATELVVEGLRRRGWTCHLLPQPVLDRSAGAAGKAAYALGLAASWLRSVRLLFARGAFLSVNLGLTKMGLIRDCVPLLFGYLGLGRERIIISLHGSPFMTWQEGSLELRLFRFLLRHTGKVTALGERQRQRLLELGYPQERIAILVNTCSVPAASKEEVDAKHADGSPRRTCLLHLSSLIDTKGFPEYLEALGHLPAVGAPAFSAVLCGKLIPSEFSERWRDTPSAQAWIEERVAEANLRPGARVEWIQGAVGAEKSALFHRAGIFVLPTRYSVEAQPLVLLEAMAAGCAIVTTGIGEIPTILDRESAVFLEEPSSMHLARQIALLMEDGPRRRQLAMQANRRFVERYGVERHLDAWETLLREVPGKERP